MTDVALTAVPNFDKLEVVKSGTCSFTAFAGGGTFNEVEHNLGYIPVVLATCHSPNFAGVNRAMVPFLEIGAGDAFIVHAQIANVRTDIIQFEVYLGASATGAAGEWDFTYYLLRPVAT